MMHASEREREQEREKRERERERERDNAKPKGGRDRTDPGRKNSESSAAAQHTPVGDVVLRVQGRRREERAPPTRQPGPVQMGRREGRREEGPPKPRPDKENFSPKLFGRRAAKMDKKHRQNSTETTHSTKTSPNKSTLPKIVGQNPIRITTQKKGAKNQDLTKREFFSDAPREKFAKMDQNIGRTTPKQHLPPEASPIKSTLPKIVGQKPLRKVVPCSEALDARKTAKQKNGQHFPLPNS